MNHSTSFEDRAIERPARSRRRSRRSPCSNNRSAWSARIAAFYPMRRSASTPSEPPMGSASPGRPSPSQYPFSTSARPPSPVGNINCLRRRAGLSGPAQRRAFRGAANIPANAHRPPTPCRAEPTMVLPLRERIVEQSQLHYNGMLLGVFQLLEARQAEIQSGRSYVESLRDYWIARTDLECAVGGRLHSRANDPIGLPSAADRLARPWVPCITTIHEPHVSKHAPQESGTTGFCADDLQHRIESAPLRSLSY